MKRRQKRTKRLASAAERDFAAEIGGRRTFNSGAGLEKGDARVSKAYKNVGGMIVETKPGFRIENKTTISNAYRLSATDWATLRGNAMRAGEEPVFHIRLNLACSDEFDLVVVTRAFYESLYGEGAARTDFAVDGARGFRISEARWARAVEELGEHPHLRGCIQERCGRAFDLVVMSRSDFMAHVTEEK